MKRIDIGGKSYRMRRGKLVEIPEQWVGKVTTDKTIRQRPSKVHRKLRRVIKNDGLSHEEAVKRIDDRAPTVDEFE